MGEALVIVDFQNDFTPGGALAVPHGDEIAGRVRELAESGRFDVVVATRDWHPPDHGSFAERGGTRAHPASASTSSSTRARTPRPRATRGSRTPRSSGSCATAASTA